MWFPQPCQEVFWQEGQVALKHMLGGGVID